MSDLVSQDGGQLSFIVHDFNKAAVHEHVTCRSRKGIQGTTVHYVELVGKVVELEMFHHILTHLVEVTDHLRILNQPQLAQSRFHKLSPYLLFFLNGEVGPRQSGRGSHHNKQCHQVNQELPWLSYCHKQISFPYASSIPRIGFESLIFFKGTRRRAQGIRSR